MNTRYVVPWPVVNPHYFSYTHNKTAVTADLRPVYGYAISPPCLQRIVLHHYVLKSKQVGG